MQEPANTSEEQKMPSELKKVIEDQFKDSKIVERFFLEKIQTVLEIEVLNFCNKHKLPLSTFLKKCELSKEEFELLIHGNKGTLVQLIKVIITCEKYPMFQSIDAYQLWNSNIFKLPKE